MRFFQLTVARARALEPQWRAVINRYRGAAPSSLGLAHMVAETNGNETPTIRNLKQRPVGIMKVPLRRSRSLGYYADALANTTNNIYVWCRLTNIDSHKLSQQYATDWTVPNTDFWLSVRLIFIIGFPNYEKLFEKVFPNGSVSEARATTLAEEAAAQALADATTLKPLWAGEVFLGYIEVIGDIAPTPPASSFVTVNQTTAKIQTWIRDTMTSTQRFGTLNARDLRRIADHLDDTRDVMHALDGPQFTSKRFSQLSIVAPGTDSTKFRTLTAVGAV